jgi:hypothetical protein
MPEYTLNTTVGGNITFSKIKLRTKSLSPVWEEELSKREILFSDFEKCIYVKDLQGNLLMFLPVDNRVISDNFTWSSQTIVDYINNYLKDNTFDVLDGGYF